MEPCCRGGLERWNPGGLESWNPVVAVDWNAGTLVDWKAGTLLSRWIGKLEPCCRADTQRNPVVAVDWNAVPLHTHHITRVGQDHVYTKYMTVYLLESLANTTCIHCVYMVLANPTRNCKEGTSHTQTHTLHHTHTLQQSHTHTASVTS